MKRWLITLLAATAVAGSLPAAVSAHEDDEAGYVSDWGGNVRTYASFDAEYRHIVDGIRHGMSDGSYNRYEASTFYNQMQRIRQRAYFQQVRGDYDPEWIETALETLHDRMHAAHERGHDRIDSYYANRGYYGGRGSYGYSYDNRGYGNRGSDQQYSQYGYRQ